MISPQEIIVINDGSGEETARICDAYLDRVQYVEQENRGPAAARNRGIKLTDAPLLAFLDADDIWEAQKLAVQVALMKAQPEVAMLCSETWEFGTGLPLRRKHASRHPEGPPGLAFPELVLDNPIATLTVLLRRTVLEQVGLFDEDPELISVEDYDLWLRIAEQHSLLWIDEPLARYRKHQGALSSAERLASGVSAVLDKLERRHGGNRGILARIRQHRRKTWLNLSWSRLERGEAEGAFAPILEALALSPSHWPAWRLLLKAVLCRFGLVPKNPKRVGSAVS